MDQVKDIMNELAMLATEQTLKTMRNHGAVEPIYGVRIGDMKPILKRHKNDHKLALELFKTGNSDAMYLAGLMSKPALMTPEVLDEWMKGASWHMISQYTVAWNAAESPYKFEMARKWIESDDELTADAGWATWAGILALTPDDQLDKQEIDGLLDRELWWFLADMSAAHGLADGLQQTRLRVESHAAARLRRQAQVLRWVCLLGSAGAVIGLTLWHYAAIDELRRALMQFHASG